MHNPAENILDDLQKAPDGWQWVVFHSKPRCEKKIENLQRQRPAKIFLPCIERVHNYGARKRVNLVPMFTGYVFGMIQKEDKTWFRQNANVANIIEVLHEESFLAPLQAIARALSEGMTMEVYPEMAPGKKVMIIGGSMKGLEAEVIEIKGVKNVLLHLEMIQQTVALEIEVSHLKLIT